jgi:hypothetical protein
MRTLTEDEVAQAMALRDQKWSWLAIQDVLHVSKHIIRDALVERGYEAHLPGTGGAKWSEAQREEVYDMHVREGLSFAEIARRLNYPPSTVARNVHRLERRRKEAAPKAPKPRTVCVIGNAHEGDLYCAQRCEDPNCDERVTYENLAAFDRFQARRRAIVNGDKRRAEERRLMATAKIRCYESPGEDK